MTLNELLLRGPDGNPHLILTDFAVGGDNVVGKNAGRWTTVWVPIVPVGMNEEARKGQPVALLYSTWIKNEKELKSLIALEKLHGMVINKVKSVGVREEQLLRWRRWRRWRL